MLTSTIAATLLAAATFTSAASIPKDDIAMMKRNIIDRQRRLAKRQSVTAVGTGDVTILNFALTLEHLENAFYTQALQKFNESAFNSAGYNGAYSVLEAVAADEAQHVTFLTSALSAAGATPVEACNYTFPYTDVKSFLALSQVIEGTGVSAYLGAAGAINTTDYITAAGSILTVEARHNAFISFLNGYLPNPSPEDTPQSATDVVTIVTPFFTSCPSGSAPTIMGHPALNFTAGTNIAVGSTIQIAPSNSSVLASHSGTVYCGFASGLSAGFSTYSNGSCQVPTANVTDGQTYVVLTSGPSLADSSVLAGPAIALIGTPNVTVTSSAGNSSSSGSGGSSGSGSASGAAASGSSGAKSPATKVVAGAGGLLLAGFLSLLV